MFAPTNATSYAKGRYTMAAKKKTPATPPAKKGRKAPKTAVEAVTTPPAETPIVEPTTTEVSTAEASIASDEVPATDLAGTPPASEAIQEPERMTPQAEVCLEEPNAVTERTAAESPTTPDTTLRFWQVRRGPQIIGQTQAGTEEWALKQAHKQFGDDVTVEPGHLAPGPKARASRVRKEAKDPGKLSALDAAAKVLGETGQPMTCQELIGAMAVKGYWSSPAGKTPAATLYSAMLREATTKGDASRFVKAARGKFALRQQP
jgi:hypothetical protein